MVDDTPSAPFRRPVPPSERLYLAGLGLVSPVCLHVAVEGAGALGEGALRDAVASAAKENPGCRLALRGGGRRLEWVAQPEPPPVRVEPFDASDLDANAWLRDDVDPRAGPTCSVHLLPGPRVVFRAFHGVMDGQGVLAWAQDVFRALRGEAVQGHLSPCTDEELAARGGARPTRPALRPNAPCALVPRGADATDYSWTRRKIYGLPRLSVPALAEALASLHRDLGEARPLRIMVPVDLRSRAPDVASTGNLSLPLFLDVPVDATSSVVGAQLLDLLARGFERAKDPAERWLGRLPPWVVRGSVRLVCQLGSRTGGFPATAILSHLGKVDLQGLSTSSFQASSVWSLPVHAGLVPLSLTVVEHPEHVELACCAPAHPEARRRAATLLDLAERAGRASTASRPADWNRTERELPSVSIYEAFLRQARARPGAAAHRVLPSGSDDACEVSTYADLDADARRVAQRLQGLGVASGQRVVVLLERGPHLLPAWLGVLALGAAVVPVDPGAPSARIGLVFEDSAPAAALVTSATRALAPHDFEGAVCAVDAAPPESAAPESLPPVDPEAVAYVMYTSGSTGRPKGVAVSQRAFVNYAFWARAAYGLGPGTRFGCFTSPAFDLTLTSTLVPLLAGGSVTLLPEPFDPLTPRRLAGASGVNALKLTPAHLRMLVEPEAGLAASSLRLLVVGGAQLPVDVAARAQEALGDEARIVNEYGPTELAVGCTHHVFDPAGDAGRPSVPIGRPGFNLRAYVLDPTGAPAPIGSAGELWVAGAGLAAGYLGDVEQTASRFTALPAVGEARAYRTGDRVRFVPGGVLQFLGRADRQLEIRGHRVEPAEIEGALEAHPGVLRAAVAPVAHPARPSARVVGAWFVPSGDAPTAEELRAHLASRLPAALHPSWILPVTELPMTARGKLQTDALPLPEGAEPAPEVADPVELAVREIWARALGVEPASLAPDASLDALGGDSLVLVDLFRGVHSALVPEVDPRELLEQLAPSLPSPTPGEMADAVRALRVARPPT